MVQVSIHPTTCDGFYESPFDLTSIANTGLPMDDISQQSNGLYACPVLKAYPRLCAHNNRRCLSFANKNLPSTVLRHHVIGTHSNSNRTLPPEHPFHFDPQLFEELSQWNHHLKNPTDADLWQWAYEKIVAAKPDEASTEPQHPYWTLPWLTATLVDIMPPNLVEQAAAAPIPHAHCQQALQHKIASILFDSQISAIADIERRYAFDLHRLYGPSPDTHEQDSQGEYMTAQHQPDLQCTGASFPNASSEPSGTNILEDLPHAAAGHISRDVPVSWSPNPGPASMRSPYVPSEAYSQNRSSHVSVRRRSTHLQPTIGSDYDMMHSVAGHSSSTNAPSSSFDEGSGQYWPGN